MHAEVLAYVSSVLDLHPIDYERVVEFGSLDINGSVRSLFGECTYVGVDLQEGPGVDVVADAAEFTPDWHEEPESKRADIVVACEVFEHASNWREIVKNAARLLREGGLFIVTAASGNRGRHSGIDTQPIRDWEFYANVDPEALGAAFRASFKYGEIRTARSGQDVQGYGVR